MRPEGKEVTWVGRNGTYPPRKAQEPRDSRSHGADGLTHA